MSLDSESGAGNQHDDLGQLAATCGIELDWWDSLGNHHVVSEQSLRHLLAALGVLAQLDASDEDIAQALCQEQQATWQRALPAVRVVYDGEASGIEYVVEAAQLNTPLDWTVTLENGELLRGSTAATHLAMAGVDGGGVGDSHAVIDERRLQLRWLGLPALPIGYHQLVVTSGGASCDAHMIVAPRRCHESTAGTGDGRGWGLSIQLYAMQSARNAGAGDFGDLLQAVKATHALGADILGINPLHALFAHAPEEASPYSPSSRVFLNPLYIDLDRTPGHALIDPAVAGTRPSTDSELVDYSSMANYKHQRLEAAFAVFDSHPDCEAERSRFDHWLSEQDKSLHDYASFELLRELDTSTTDSPRSDWRRWDAEWRDPGSATVAELVASHATRVRYFSWLQWVAASQLDSAAELASELDLDVGLYRDLAVGIAANGADAWMDQSVYMHGVHVGAPPDDFSVNGQDWGLPPMNPRELSQRGYAPFRTMLRSNMSAAGALRIDHVMGLARLFCIPAGGLPTDGAYVGNKLDEMLAVLAIESVRAGCIIIGEDLGTVPDGFRERLQQAGVLSYRLMYFEKHYDGDHGFRKPHEYADTALVGANTHDLPTLTGFWNGVDIDCRAERNLFPSQQMHDRQRNDRVADRYRLLAALAEEGLLPEGIDPTQPDAVSMDRRLIDAVHQYLARTASRLLVINVEDLLGATEQMNLPGTDRDRYPNWRRRLELPVDQWVYDPRFLETSQLMQQERP